MRAAAYLIVFLFMVLGASSQGVDSYGHDSLEWTTLAPHLPDLATAAPQTIETAADVLRARRFPEEALKFYEAALRRGGDEARLLNRIGIVQLELREVDLARASFRRVTQAKPKNAEAWNNLGAAEYVAGNFKTAIFNYRRAVKLNKRNAIFRSNLGTGLFEMKDYEGATAEFQTAAKLDPSVFQQNGTGGVEARVLSQNERGRFCFELARVTARTGDTTATLLWLKRSSEAGYDIRYEMQGIKEFAALRDDPRVVMLAQNAKAMRTTRVASVGPAPALPAEIEAGR